MTAIAAPAPRSSCSGRAAPRSGAACAICCPVRGCRAARAAAIGTRLRPRGAAFSRDCSRRDGRSSALCASGILIRAVAPLLADKHAEPPVVAVAEDGSVAVPLLGGHHGANALARALAEAFGGVAAITTAGDLRLGFALDEPPPGWRIANPRAGQAGRGGAACRRAGRCFVDEAGRADWLRAGSGRMGGARPTAQSSSPIGRRRGRADARLPSAGAGARDRLRARLFRRGDRALWRARRLAEAGLAAGAVAAVVSIELKLAEPGIHALAAALGVPARFFPAARLLAETARLTERSEAAFRATGCWGVAEGAALAAAGPDGALVVPRRKSRRATCAVARAPAPLDPEAIGRPRGRLGDHRHRPGRPGLAHPGGERRAGARPTISSATALSRPARPRDRRQAPARQRDRRRGGAGAAGARSRRRGPRRSRWSRRAMPASTVWRALGLRADRPRDSAREWSAVEIAVCSRRLAMQAAAARAGAPLGHDFCAISLSDLMTPWAAIRARLEAAAAADFVVALTIRARRGGRRISPRRRDICCAHRPPETPVRHRPQSRPRRRDLRRSLRLDELADADIDMLSIVLVGSSADPPRSPATRRALYTPRGYFDEPARDRAFHRRRARRARPDHGARAAADRALPGLPLRRLAGAARDRRRRAARRAGHRYRAADPRRDHRRDRGGAHAPASTSRGCIRATRRFTARSPSRCGGSTRSASRTT